MHGLLRVIRPVTIGSIALAALVFVMTPGIALAQLTKADVQQLQQQAKDEGWTFTVSQNPATEYSLDQLCGLKEPANWREGAPFDDMGTNNTIQGGKSLPAAFDWRTQVPGGMPPIRNQGGCGSCWAFATAGAFECNIKIKDQVNVDLSEQYLVSCNPYGYNCPNGGWWVHDMHTNVGDPCGSAGAVLEQYDPYQQSDAPCTCPYPHDYKLKGWSYVGAQWSTPSVTQIKQAIYDHGPVSVAVSVNSAFQAYSGGIFNGCNSTSINHAVVIVGWDDSQAGGIWIIRNSWGQYWGEGGYMRMPYNCSMIGYNATYVDYPGRLAIQGDVTLGPAPLNVNFSIGTSLTVLSAAWTFGDATTANVPAPSHTYTNPGLYNVGLTAICPDGSHSTTSSSFVAVYADTLIGSKVNAGPGQQVTIDIYARNFLPLDEIMLPITWNGSAGLNFDSSSTAGLRSNYMGVNQWIYLDPGYNMQGTYRLAVTNNQVALAPGSGPILRLYFTVSPAATGSSNPVVVSSVDNGSSIYNPVFRCSSRTYLPEIKSGSVVLCRAGDVNSDGHGPDLADLASLVTYLTGAYYGTMTANANCNGTGGVDLADLSYLTYYLTGVGAAPVCP
ncbi:MAG: C1 family peptidase [Candidatus Zixiibacteriota bacterium]